MDDLQGHQDNTMYQDGSGYYPQGGGVYGDENPYPAESPVYPDATPYQEPGQDYQYDNGQYGDENPYPPESPVYQDPSQGQGQDYQYPGEGVEEGYESYQDEGGGYDEGYAGETWWDDTRIATGLVWLTHAAGILGIGAGIFGIISSGGSVKEGAYKGLNYAAPLMVGAPGILCFLRYSVFHRSDAIRSGEEPEESYFQKEAGLVNLAIGFMALLIFFGGWGTTAEVAITLIYAIYSSLALVLAFLRRIEYDDLDGAAIFHLVIWLVCTGFLFFFGFTAAPSANLFPF